MKQIRIFCLLMILGLLGGSGAAFADHAACANLNDDSLVMDIPCVSIGGSKTWSATLLPEPYPAPAGKEIGTWSLKPDSVKRATLDASNSDCALLTSSTLKVNCVVSHGVKNYTSFENLNEATEFRLEGCGDATPRDPFCPIKTGDLGGGEEVGFDFSTSTGYNGFTSNWPSTWKSYFGDIKSIQDQKPTGDISAYGFKDSGGNTISKVSEVYVAAIPFRYPLGQYGDRHTYIEGVIESSQGSNSDDACYLAQQLPSTPDFSPVNIDDNKRLLSSGTANSDNPVYLIVPNQFCGGNSWVKDQTGIPVAQDVLNSCTFIQTSIDDKDLIAKNCKANVDPTCNAFCTLAAGVATGTPPAGSWPDIANTDQLMQELIANGSCNPGVGLIHASESPDCQSGSEEACYKYKNNPNILAKVASAQTSYFGSQCLNEYTLGSGHSAANTYNNWCSGANMHFDFNKGDIKNVYRIKAVPCNVAGNINVGTIVP
ncbi:MAG: hypothetical protein HOE45_04070 [Gammaproteobacteria bacterium]|nr:hypothetical protein [Gammaproteobacteria bacterium]MBT4146048.1 hypothetical protein [Gammaproteobacteria bacterium]MBT5222219.1 hypothetical protein [Gammaproteobacteria bacterium]MBT5826696.1 hypothetical protein [Gammaproteobacteria bacterium]MBT5966836.1 hypothetical protein [Gammaproteobacteria bacterium]